MKKKPKKLRAAKIAKAVKIAARGASNVSAKAARLSKNRKKQLSPPSEQEEALPKGRTFESEADRKRRLEPAPNSQLTLEQMLNAKEPSEKEIEKKRAELAGKVNREWPRHIDRLRWVAMNQTSNVRLVVARSDEELFYLSFDSSELVVDREAIHVFNNEYRPYPYDIRTAAKKWLYSPRFTVISDVARKELQAIIDRQVSPIQQEILNRRKQEMEKQEEKQSTKKGKKKKETKPVVVSTLGKDLVALRGNAPVRPDKPVKTRQPGSGARIRALLMEGGRTPTDIIKIIHKEFPSSKATEKDVAWNRSYLISKEGQTPPAYPGSEPVKEPAKAKDKKPAAKKVKPKKVKKGKKK